MVYLRKYSTCQNLLHSSKKSVRKIICEQTMPVWNVSRKHLHVNLFTAVTGFEALKRTDYAVIGNFVIEMFLV